MSFTSNSFIYILVIIDNQQLFNENFLYTMNGDGFKSVSHVNEIVAPV